MFWYLWVFIFIKLEFQIHKAEIPKYLFEDIWLYSFDNVESSHFNSHFYLTKKHCFNNTIVNIDTLGIQNIYNVK